MRARLMLCRLGLRSAGKTLVPQAAPNTACSRPAQLPKLSIRFDGWRSGRWRAADARPLGALLLSIMNHTKPWRWSEMALLIVIVWLLISIVALLAARIVPAPFDSEVSPARTGNTDAIATQGFTTAFMFAENASAAIKNYQQDFSLHIGLLIVGGIGLLYGGALLIYGLLLRLRFQPGMYVALGGLSLIWVGLAGLNSSNNPNADAISNCARLQDLYNSRQYQMTEGIVHVSHVQSVSGHDSGDIFTVGNVGFEVSHFASYCAYGKTIAYGGVLTEGAHVKLLYADNRTILRIDVKNQ